MEDGSGLQPAAYASYALHHVQRHQKHLDKDEVQIVFADMTPEEMSSGFVTSFGDGEEGELKRR